MLNRKTFFTLPLLLALVFTTSLSISSTSAGEQETSITPPDCPFCQNKGYRRCLKCGGSGISYRADIECPKCGGKGTTTCDKCDENGKVTCPDCKKRTIDGKEVFAIKNPEWINWNKKYMGLRNRTFTEKARSRIPDEPEKYISCPKCKGTGLIDCPTCNGKKEIQCSKCDGEGKIKGKGPCPGCEGKGIIPCERCASMEGVDKEGATVLDKLYADKILDKDEYFKRRRILTAKAAASAEANGTKTKVVKPDVADNNDNNKVEAADFPVFDKDAQIAKLKSLYNACINKAISLKTYIEKARELGLSKEDVDAVEKDASADSAIGKYAKLKKRFRDGEIDYEKYKFLLKEI